MTPLQIKMVLHYYAIAEPYALLDPAHAKSAAVCAQRALLCSDGLIEATAEAQSGYRITPRGEAYVDALCAMPLPVSKWVMP